MKGQLGFFDLADRYAQLSKSGDPLEHLSATVDFEPFRYRLVKVLKRSDGAKGGRPPYDPVLMFKILILQALYGLSDEQAEFQIRDRLSFMRFLGLGLNDRVPDATTIWLFREQLTRAGAVKKLFERFDALLRDKGYVAMSGQSQANEEYLLSIGKVSRIHRKKPKGKPMARHIAKANARKSVIRSKVEHVFAGLKDRMGLFVRTIGLDRATTKIGLANIAYNMRRLIWLDTRNAPA